MCLAVPENGHLFLFIFVVHVLDLVLLVLALPSVSNVSARDPFVISTSSYVGLRLFKTAHHFLLTIDYFT